MPVSEFANLLLFLDAGVQLYVSFMLSYAATGDTSASNDPEALARRRAQMFYRLALWGAFLTLLVGSVHVVCRNIVGTGPAVTFVALAYAGVVTAGLVLYFAVWSRRAR